MLGMMMMTLLAKCDTDDWHCHEECLESRVHLRKHRRDSKHSQLTKSKAINAGGVHLGAPARS